MGVTVTPTNGANYTWQTATWGWNDPKSLVAWATSYPVSYDQQVTEAVAAVELLKNSTTKPLAEAFAVGEARNASYGLNPFEAVAVAEMNAKTAKKPIAEAIVVAESLAKNYGMNRSEAFATSDGSAFTYQQAVAEVLAVLDSINNIIVGVIFDLPFGESVTITDARPKSNISKAIAEAFAVTDARPSSAFTQSIAEAIAIAESRSANATKNSADSLTVSDVVASSVAQSILEVLNIVEMFSETAQFYLNLSESVTFAESLGKNVAKPLTESFAVADGRTTKMTQNVAEAIAFAEGFARVVQFYKDIAEALGVSDKLGKILPPHNASESFSIEDAIAHIIEHRPVETLAIGELLSKNGSQAINETITVTDSLGKTYSLKVSEALRLIETYMRKANAVFSNMAIINADMTAREFANAVDSGTVVGYEGFHDFIPGDYTYQKALFRVIIESVNSDRARLNNLSVTVDVPDIFDRGQVVIDAAHAAAGVAVAFNREFHAIPEVTLTLKGGGIVAIPNVLNPTSAGFTAILKDPTTGNGVAGTLTWAAHGY